MPKYYLDTVTGVEFEGAFELTPAERVTIDNLRAECGQNIISALQDCKFDIQTSTIIATHLGIPPLNIIDWDEIETVVGSAQPGDIVYYYNNDNQLYRTTIVKAHTPNEQATDNRAVDEFMDENPEIMDALTKGIKERKEDKSN